MKIIDLYNMIAKGETPPKIIKYDGISYNWDINKYLHYSDEILSERNLLGGLVTEMCLNDEVEIINENKIEKLSYQQIGSYLLERKDYETFTKCVNEQMSKIGKKLNDMVEAVNYLLDKDNNG